MPTYEYRCEKCNKRFSITMSIAEHDKKRITCSSCKSTKVKQQISSFLPMTDSKS